MIRARTVAAIAAFLAFWLLIWKLGVPPDAFIWIAFLALSAAAGIIGAGVVLSVRHVRARPRIGGIAAIALLVFSMPFVWSFQSAHATLPAFLSTADSMPGIVQGHNIFGNLLFAIVDTVHSGQYRGRYIGARKLAHDSLSSGDTVWVYRQPADSRVEVDPPGPDGRVFLRRLAFAWVVGGALLCGFGPYLVPRRSRTVADAGSDQADRRDGLGSA